MPAGTPADLFTSTNQPKGRPKGRTGSRAKLAQRFFEDTYAAWEEQGPSVLARAAFHDPVAFANMVARLMPQKIEVSTPTDGMSDERLAEMLELAERMAGLKAAQAKVIQGTAVQGGSSPHLLDHENGVAPLCLEGRGEGALREEGGGGIYTPSTQRADPAEKTGSEFRALNETDERADIETIKARVQALPPLSSYEQKSDIPYPVGKPFATPDHVVEKQNRSRLVEREEDIDPSSLF